MIYTLRPVDDGKNFTRHILSELKDYYEDRKELKKDILDIEAEIHTLGSQLDALKNYAEINKWGIDVEHVQKLIAAKRAREVILFWLKKTLENEVNKGIEAEIESLKNSYRKMFERIDAIEKRISPSAGIKIKNNIKRLNLKNSFLGEKLEYLILLLAQGASQEVEDRLSYWENKPKGSGSESFQEFLVRNNAKLD